MGKEFVMAEEKSVPLFPSPLGLREVVHRSLYPNLSLCRAADGVFLIGTTEIACRAVRAHSWWYQVAFRWASVAGEVSCLLRPNLPIGVKSHQGARL